MKSIKIFFLFSLLLYLSSCGAVKETFSNQKKNSSDEFLVEKKSPLIMPPDYNKLPIPGNEQEEEVENVAKTLITSKKDEINSTNSNETETNLEKSLLKKIQKKNANSQN